MEKISRKEEFIREIERRIISGELKPGDMLPTERELVSELGMSRTVIHTGLAELASMGFIRIRPRKGYVITDYRTEGTIAVLESIMHYNGGSLEPGLLSGLIDCRMLVELETAALAAEQRSETDISNLRRILKAERASAANEEKAANDFDFHHHVAVASGNPFYPLILKSFQQIQLQLINSFYSVITQPEEVYKQHEKLIDAIEAGKPEESRAVMREMLLHGEKIINNLD